MHWRAAKGELLLALVFVAVGALWVAKALGMPLWDGFAPSSGFLPLIYGCLLAGLALAVVAELLLAGAPASGGGVKKPLLVLAVLIAAVSALPFAGFVISVFFLLFLLYALVERLPWLPAMAVSAAITGGLYLIFRTWLGVPLP